MTDTCTESMAEYYLSESRIRELYEVDYDFLLQNHLWLTADKRRLPVKEMTTGHINNCIACLEGRGGMEIPDKFLGGPEGRVKWIQIFNEELSKRN